jgi:hypothetical protein
MLPNEYKISRMEYVYLKNGINNPFFYNMRTDIYRLICLLNNKILFADVENFPYIMEGFNKDKLLFYIQLFLLIEKMKCYTYKMKEYNSSMIVKDKKNMKEVLLAIFIHNNLNKEVKYYKIIKTIIVQKLQKINQKYYINLLLNRYLTNNFPKVLEKKVNVKQTTNQILEQKYELIKKYDDFKDFKLYSSYIMNEADKYINVYKNDIQFKKYYHKEIKQVKQYYFNIYDSLLNPLYTEKTKSSIHDFLSTIHFKPRHKL